MILNRMGNKSQIAYKVQQFFPRHDIYMEPFFGAGGMFFNKPKAKFNYVNDFDDDVYNLFRQLLDNKEELVEWVQKAPITETQFKEWGKGRREETPVLNAVRFLFVSNFGLYGDTSTLRISPTNPKKVILKLIDKTFAFLSDVYFLNADFRMFFKKCDYKSNIDRAFCYCDPPYLGTGNNYSASFTEQDSQDLFDTLQASELRWAMSEFDHPFIMQQAKERGLFVHTVGARQNIKNRRTEVLVTNYQIQQYSLF